METRPMEGPMPPMRIAREGIRPLNRSHWKSRCVKNVAVLFHWRKWKGWTDPSHAIKWDRCVQCEPIHCLEAKTLTHTHTYVQQFPLLPCWWQVGQIEIWLPEAPLGQIFGWFLRWRGWRGWKDLSKVMKCWMRDAEIPIASHFFT